MVQRKLPLLHAHHPPREHRIDAVARPLTADTIRLARWTREVERCPPQSSRWSEIDRGAMTLSADIDCLRTMNFHYVRSMVG